MAGSLETNDRLLPIEIKTTAQPSTKELAPMRVFLEEYGDHAPAGLVLHTGSETFWIAERVLAAPWWRVI